MRAEELWLSWRRENTCSDSGLQIPKVSTATGQGLGVETGLEDMDDTELVMAGGKGVRSVLDDPVAGADLNPGQAGRAFRESTGPMVKPRQSQAPFPPRSTIPWGCYSPCKTNCWIPVVEEFSQEKTDKDERNHKHEEVAWLQVLAKFWCNRTLSPHLGHF